MRTQDDGSAEGENSDDEEISDENDSSQTETENSENESQSGEDSSTGEISDGDADEGSGMYDGHKQDVTSSEKGRLPHEQTDRVSDPVGGSVEKTTNMNRKYTQTQQAILNRSLRKWLNELLVRNSKANERKSLTRQRRTFHTAMFIPAYMFG